MFDFIKAGYKEGSKVWGLVEGWTEITEVVSGSEYPIRIMGRRFHASGRLNGADESPTIFPNEFKIPKEAYEQPLKLDDKVLVKIDEGGVWEKRYFSHFSKGDKLHCFINGCNSWSSTGSTSDIWTHWKRPEGEE